MSLNCRCSSNVLVEKCENNLSFFTFSLTCIHYHTTLESDQTIFQDSEVFSRLFCQLRYCATYPLRNSIYSVLLKISGISILIRV